VDESGAGAPGAGAAAAAELAEEAPRPATFFGAIDPGRDAWAATVVPRPVPGRCVGRGKE
jgi:hypothetical protein